MGDVMEDLPFWGQLTNHPKYGEQLQMTRAFAPAVLSNILPKDNFKGIGKKTAERIVEIYGEDLLTRFSRIAELEQIPQPIQGQSSSLVAKLKSLWSRANPTNLISHRASQIFNQQEYH